jgi:hypothetical protein
MQAYTTQMVTATNLLKYKSLDSSSQYRAK